jgi:hypothetical protein
MPSANRESTLRALATTAAERLARAGDLLASRQISSGQDPGNVPPWAGSDDLDFHGTLAAIWIWTRAEKLTGEDRFALNIAAGWSFVEKAWSHFIPTAIGPATTDEAPYDCAMVLRTALVDRRPRGGRDLGTMTDNAARLLGVYLSDLDELTGREFRDPGFLAWSLADYAREIGERGLLSTARRFIDRAFGMKAPPAFAAEPAATDGLFDFSSTTATRIMAVLSGEGATPFVGAWLRERVAAGAPIAFVPRPMDENTWNACAAAALGRAFVISTDNKFFDAHQAIMGELDSRLEDGALGRGQGFGGETNATFYYALAVDALVKV